MSVKRRLFNFAVGVSLLLCVATCVLWVRGRFVGDCFSFHAFEDVGARSYWTERDLRFGRGGVGMNEWVKSRERDPTSSSPGYPDREILMFPFHMTGKPEIPNFCLGPEDEAGWYGFKHGAFAHIDRTNLRPRESGWQVVIPYWAIWLATSIFPSAWLLSDRARRRRLRRGLCGVCGYDLRASPGQCPECGALPASTVS
jgi:hypothetical protein